MTIEQLLDSVLENKASDLHLMAGTVPYLRIDGALVPLQAAGVLTPEMIEEMVFTILLPEQKTLLISNKELDFSIPYTKSDGSQKGRFRVNAYYQKATIAVAFRYLTEAISGIEDLKLPSICHTFPGMRQGLVLVTGPTGQGKSTTLAAMTQEINMTRPAHIITIEDPIEYVYPLGRSIISQREMKIDTHSWSMALRSALREDPDVVLIGEMRDSDTMAAAMTIAETGHLVFSTLHTNSAAQSIDRIIDSFPEHQQSQIRTQLSFVLKGIVSQRLMPQIGGGRVPAVEVLIGNSAVASNIRDGKTHLIDSIIQTSSDEGMIPLEASLAQLVASGTVALEVAKGYALHVDEFLRLLA